MGARLAHEPRYGGGEGGGHPSISDDGSGNVVIADGAQVLLPQNSTASPALAAKNNTDLGWYMSDAGMIGVWNTSQYLFINGGGVAVANTPFKAGVMAATTSADQAITAAGNSIVANAAHVKVAPSASLTLTSTPTIADGLDGQILRIENVGADDLELQDETLLAGSNLKVNGLSSVVIGVGETVSFVFSTDVGAWVMTQNRVNT